MNSKITLLVLTLGAAAALTACGDFERGVPSPVKDTGGTNNDGAPDDNTGPTNGNGGLSFAADAHPVLMDRCSGCHTATNGTALKLTGDPAVDLPVVTALINTAAPAESTLLQKCSAAVAHGGGRVCDPAGADYTTLLQWITDGAQP